MPGDAVIADDDGVVVVPRARTPPTSSPRARSAIANEEGKRKRLAAGELGLDMYNMREALAKAGLVYVDDPEED